MGYTVHIDILQFQIQLCALRAQYEIGDHIFANQFDYKWVVIAPLFI